MLQAITIVILAIVVLGIVGQHLRYLRIRRVFAQDHQRLLHSNEAFHVITFFKVRNGEKVVDSARRYIQAATGNGKARLIYAGQAGFSMDSEQLGARHWDGVVLIEFPSRLSYVENSAEALGSAVRETFADSYIHGMRRNRRRSMAMPQFLLRLRLLDIVKGKWRVEPLEKQRGLRTSPEFDKTRTYLSRMKALNEIYRQGLVVYNLVKRGSPEQQAVAESSNALMLSRMAALGYGPLHIGRSVAMEGRAKFDSVFVVQYPSARYFADLLSSQYFGATVHHGQGADTMSVPTVPITERI